MFGHSSWMTRMQKGCFIDTGDSTGGTGDFADPPETDADDSQSDDAGGETGEDADDPDQQKRTSKQDPKVDAAYREARIAKQEAEAKAKENEELRQRLEKIKEPYKKYGLHTEDDIVNAIAREEQQKAQANANEDANFSVWLKDEVSKRRAAGWDEVSIETFVDAKEARYETHKLKREAAQEKELQKREKELEKQEREKEKQSKAAEKAIGMIMDQYKDLRKEFPDLVPAGCKNFNDLMEKVDPAIRDKMLQNGLTLEDAFHIVNRKKIAKRLAAMEDEKEKDNAERSTSSGREKGDAAGGAYGLTSQQQALAREGGMSNKEYASLIKHVKK